MLSPTLLKDIFQKDENNDKHNFALMFRFVEKNLDYIG